MKKIVARVSTVVLISVVLCIAPKANGQTTPNLNLNVPLPGAPNWGTLLNRNFTILDTWSTTVCPKAACTLTGPLTAFSLTATNITPGTLPICPNGAGGTFTTSGCTGGTAANPAGPAFAINFANSLVTNFQGDSSITINPTTHTITAPNLVGNTIGPTIIVDQSANATTTLNALTSSQTAQLGVSKSLSANTTVNGGLVILQGGLLDCTVTHYTLAINGAFSAPPTQQVFSSNCAGLVTFPNQSSCQPGWFGTANNRSTDDTAAVQSCYTSTSNGNFAVTIPITNSSITGSFTYPVTHPLITTSVVGTVKQTNTIACGANTAWVGAVPNATLDATSVSNSNLTMSCNGSIGVAVDLSANVATAASTITFASDPGYAVGQELLLTDDEYFKDLGTGSCTGQPQYCKGEIVTVCGTGATETLCAPTFDSYATASTARVQPITPLTNFSVSGLTVNRTAQSTTSNDCWQFNYANYVTLKNNTLNNCTEAAVRMISPQHLVIDGLTATGTWFSGTGTSYVFSCTDACQFGTLNNINAVGQRHAVAMNTDSSRGTTRMMNTTNVVCDATQVVSNGICIDAHENSQYINYTGVVARGANQSANWCVDLRGYNSSISDFNCYSSGGVDLANSAFGVTNNRIGPGVVNIMPGSVLSGVHVNGSGNVIHDVHVVAADAANDTGSWTGFESVSDTTSDGAINTNNHFDNDVVDSPRGVGFYLYTTTNSSITNFVINNGHTQGVELIGRVADSQGSNNNVIVNAASISVGSYCLYNASTFNTGNYYDGVNPANCPSGLILTAGGTPWATSFPTTLGQTFRSLIASGDNGGFSTDSSGNTTTGGGSMTVGGESGQATFLACYVTGGKLGHCTTAPTGTPPTCTCTNP